MFLLDCGLAVRDLDLNQCRVRGTWARCCVCSRAHTLCSGDSRRSAPWLEFPEGQVQRQLLQMDQGGWGPWSPACGGNHWPGKAMLSLCSCRGPVGCLAGSVLMMSFHFCLLPQIPCWPSSGMGEFVLGSSASPST